MEYRLAPEHPYPAALDDRLSALECLAHEPTADSSRISLPGPALAVDWPRQLHSRPTIDLKSPWLHRYWCLRCWMTAPAARLTLVIATGGCGTVPAIDSDGRRTLGQANATTAAPSRRGDLTGLPPAWIGVGTLDILHDEAVDYARRLAAADVPCNLEVVPGTFHGFDAVAPKTALAQSFIASQLAFLRRAFDSV